MIQETIRQITAEERDAMPVPLPPRCIAPRSPGFREEAWMLGVGALVLAGIVVIQGVPRGAHAAGLFSASMVPVVLFVRAYVRDLRFRRAHPPVLVPATPPPPGVREDGRVVVKRVTACAVVEIEEVEDEGRGWLYDLGDGRVLFLKGLDYSPLDDDTPWPNTEFEIVRGLVDREFVAMAYHGRALAPLRVIRRDEYDVQAMWDEREEVIEGTLEEVIRTRVLKR
ncbi:MAG TPA: hypothetical protein VF665_16515 [Longimicrobium sp.]|jgi:hypothetical protein|uniref:hypothetical protein n=1 Tax=Longimicrobium sp. TaxID=2029185 RepID=UPI002EDA0F46